jgi:hypothetical protein
MTGASVKSGQGVSKVNFFIATFEIEGVRAGSGAVGLPLAKDTGVASMHTELTAEVVNIQQKMDTGANSSDIVRVAGVVIQGTGDSGSGDTWRPV